MFRPELEKEIGKFEYWGWMIFGTKQIANNNFTQEINGKEIKMEIRFTKQCTDLKEIMSQSVEKSDSVKQIINILLKKSFKELGFKEIGLRKNFYDISKLKRLEQWKIEMWLGFFTSAEYF